MRDKEGSRRAAVFLATTFSGDGDGIAIGAGRPRPILGAEPPHRDERGEYTYRRNPATEEMERSTYVWWWWATGSLADSSLLPSGMHDRSFAVQSCH
jgi:hypothetical protein